MLGGEPAQEAIPSSGHVPVVLDLIRPPFAPFFRSAVRAFDPGTGGLGSHEHDEGAVAAEPVNGLCERLATERPPFRRSTRHLPAIGGQEACDRHPVPPQDDVRMGRSEYGLLVANDL